MKNSSVRFYVHIAFFCHMPELPYHQGNRLLSETVLLRLPAPRYLPVSAPVSAIMKPNMKAVKKKDCGDEQFEIADTRSLKQMYDDIKQQGLWPVLNDYLYV